MGVPSPHFELDGVEGRFQQMDGAVVGGDDEVAVRLFGIFVSADQKFQRKVFEHEIVGHRVKQARSQEDFRS